MLSVGQVEIIGAVGGQYGRDQGIGVVRAQPGPFVVIIVVPRQLPAVRVGQPEHGIQGRIELAGIDFGDDFLALATFEAETSQSPGRLIRPLTMIGSTIG